MRNSDPAVGHPLGVAAYVMLAIAATASAVAVSLMVAGALMSSNPMFLAGIITTLAGATLAVQAQSLGSRAVAALAPPEPPALDYPSWVNTLPTWRPPVE